MALLSLSDAKHPANIVISTVESQLGKGYYWQKEVTGVTGDWCAATVVAAGLYTNLSGKVFPTKGQEAVYCAGMCGKAFLKFGGKRIDGPLWGNTNVQPSRGDIIVFVWKKGNESFYNSVKSKTAQFKEWSASHIGIVTDSSSKTVYTIEGNLGGRTDKSKNAIKKDSYSINNECISFYIRPDWSRADGVVSYTEATTGTYVPTETPTTSTYKIDGVYSTQLYTTESTKADASMREIAYLGTDGKPTTSVTGVRLAVINYTGLLSSIYRLFQTPAETATNSSTDTTTPDNIDGLASIPRTIVSYLSPKGYNTAASIGIAANIQHESNFKSSAIGDNGTSFGLCQWHNERGISMMKYVGSDWSNNLSGQLDYMLLELDTTYASLSAELKSIPNTVAGAKSAADKFARQFVERPTNIEEASAKCQATASDYWSKIVTTTAASSADYSSDPTVQKFPCKGTPYLVWPLPSKPVGQYSSPFGYRGIIKEAGATTYHSGVDVDVNQKLGASTDIPIVSCADGVIYKLGYTLSGNKIAPTKNRGYYVIVDHGALQGGSGHAYTLYQHMKYNSMRKVNESVKAGEVVGYVGNTGVGNYHLHLEVHLGKTLGMSNVEYYDNSYGCWRNHYAVNPAQYFPKG